METLFAMLDQAGDGAYVVDGSQRVVYWNEAAQELLGYGPDEVHGRLCYEILRGRSESDQSLCRHNCDVVAAVEAGEGISHFNLLTRTKAGSLRWLDVSILGLPEAGAGRTSLTVHLVRDATEAKQREQFSQSIIDAASGYQRRLADLNLAAAADSAASRLTSREREVLTLLTRGLSTREIAKSLSIAPSTVRNHTQNVMTKFQVHNRAALVAYAFEHGITALE